MIKRESRIALTFESRESTRLRDRIRWPSGPKLAAGVIVVLTMLGTSNALAQQDYADGGARACLKCHENEKIMGILETPHANREDSRTPAAREKCESCHGPSGTHMKFPMQVGNIRFSKHDESTSAAKRDSACLECHKNGAGENWKMGPHGFEKLSCPSCHSIHKSRDPFLSQEDQTLMCTDACHEKIVKEALAKSPHPFFGEKKILCTSCHNPHGPLDMAVCSECHPQNSDEFAKQVPKTRGYHERALRENIDCIDCHKAFVHAPPEITLSGANLE
jgi:predicted CXXCH cytochrome family protein